MTTTVVSSFCQFLVVLVLCCSSCYGYSELEALMKLKSAMTGPDGSGLEDWNDAASSHCSFSGVTCDAEAELRVVALSVANLPLSGHLSPEIGLLSELINLTVTSANLTGKIPSELRNLASLRFLNISNNLFVGSFPGEIVLGATELETLDVYNNNLTGVLPLEVAGLKRLKYLNLGGNFFSGEIPENYSEISGLEFLGLSGNLLTGKIPRSLSRLKNLKQLYLGYYNNYDSEIPSELGSLSSLELLDMGSCNLSGEIPRTLGNLKHLHSLFLQINRLSGLIPSELSGLVSLMALDLSINLLSGEIPTNFSGLKNLALLNLCKNNFYGQVPEFIGELPNLEVLHIWENNFTDNLPESLGRNGRLKDLDVTYNHFTGPIPRDLCRGRRLKTLILMNNFFIGPIPEDLGHCKSLTKIRISKNFFNGTIPAGIFTLPTLGIIELNDNHFSGELPSKMAGDSLGILDLSNNRISGKIPPAISKIENLQTVALQLNRFDSDIPEEIFNLKLLSKINVSANKLSGEIPDSISRCLSLTAVDFSRNNLIGEVPKGISKLRDLNVLNLSRNHITGQLPGELIQFMSALTTLDLSFNNLTGRVPMDGRFVIFNNMSFIGNPYLCLSGNAATCPSTAEDGHHRKGLTSLQLAITIISIAAVISVIALVLYRIRAKKLHNARKWKLVAFQRLEFRAEDVIECLKDENIIGKGGVGVFYRGLMPDGSTVAIKKLQGRSDNRFSAVIQTLGQIRHRNIMRVLGYMSNNETDLVLYEYMPNRSLGEMLHGANEGQLGWETRYKVAVDAAKGLCYLHHDCSPLIIHRNVKSNNILLDADMDAHVGDFSLTKFLHDAGEGECMSSITGSYGYIAPEYAYTLEVDEKSDVYSFGVLLLELIAGKKPVGEFGDGVDIVRWVRKTVAELSQPSDAGTVLAVIDPRLQAYQLTAFVHLFKIAMVCVENESCARPTMREVVYMLTNPPLSNK